MATVKGCQASDFASLMLVNLVPRSTVT